MALVKLKSRLELSRAKHRSLSGHARMARKIAALVPFYEFDEQSFFRSDEAPQDIAQRRRDGFMRLSKLFGERFSQTSQLTAEAREGISDLQFTRAEGLALSWIGTGRIIFSLNYADEDFDAVATAAWRARSKIAPKTRS